MSAVLAVTRQPSSLRLRQLASCVQLVEEHNVACRTSIAHVYQFSAGSVLFGNAIDERRLLLDADVQLRRGGTAESQIWN